MITLTRTELQSVIAVSLIISLRLLGIFLLLPVFSVLAKEYPGATYPLVGLAFGIYPLVQSFLQLPFGWASDRFGRRTLIVLGLALFCAGSIVAARAGDINALIFARVLQGSGAVGAVAMAALGDYTRPEVRTQAFTVTGVVIGMAFMLGIIGGPIIAAKYGLASLFYILAALGLVAIVVAWVFLPDGRVASDSEPELKVAELFRRADIRELFIAALVCSLVLNLFFFIYPLSLEAAGIGHEGLWKVYLVVLLPSLLLVFPYIRRAEGRGGLGPVPLIGFFAMLAGFVLYLVTGSPLWSLYVSAALFFLGYTLYQSILPSFLTQRVPQQSRGKALGFYNLSSFFGASAGGILAGYLYTGSEVYPLLLGIVVMAVWPFTGLPRPGKKGS